MEDKSWKRGVGRWIKRGWVEQKWNGKEKEEERDDGRGVRSLYWVGNDWLIQRGAKEAEFQYRHRCV